MEAGAEQTDGAEEPLHCEKRPIVDQVECPESATGSVKTTHEVDNDVEDEDSKGRKRDVGEQVSDRDNGRAIHAVICLQWQRVH